MSEDRQNVNQLRQQTKQLVKEAAILRQSQFKAPHKSRQTLDWDDLNGSSRGVGIWDFLGVEVSFKIIPN